MPDASHIRSDRDVVARVRSGDERAFTQMFHDYWAPLCRFAAFTVRDPDDVREIVAKVFASLWERRAQWAVATTVEAYLFGAVRNEVRHRHRDATRRAALMATEGTSDEAATATLWGEAATNGRAAGERADLELTIEWAVRQLPERYQLAIHLRWRRDLDYPEIAEALGVSAEAAKKLVLRALAMLRQRVDAG
jgi:RNA polymerase sigma factor (sigma-70 family)